MRSRNFLPILATVNGLEGCSEDFNIFQGTHLGELSGQVEPGLPSHTGENPIRLFLLDDLCDHISPQGFDINDDLPYPGQSGWLPGLS